ncbi:hypothetical protein HMPREF1221_02000 [Treponema socranskii subsp. paredis ATCC 35535]|jgi:protein capG|nr:hypothetical protein HMPREF1221_02000 [Treponema socranskii subsp. paredis ATCC 35535]
MKKALITKVIYIIYRIRNRILRKAIVSRNIFEFVKNGGLIGKDCEVFPNVDFGSEPYLIEIGNKVRLTDSVKFFTHDGALWVIRNLYPEMQKADKFGKIKICDNVHIGWNVMIMPGVTIGKNSIVGCGSIVTKDVPDNTVVAGIPARIVESIDCYYKKNKEKIIMTKGLSYLEKKKKIQDYFNIKEKNEI